MNDHLQMRDVVLGALIHVAPNIDPAGIDPDTDLSEQLDLDSMDFLNVVLEIHERTGIEVPERDYPRLSTLSDAVTYLETAFERSAG